MASDFSGDYSPTIQRARLRWEVPEAALNERWRTYSKGGDYAPFYYDLHLVIDWADETQALYCGNTTVFSCLVTRNKDKYAFRPGLTYATRTTAPVSFRVLPAGSIFDTKGSAVFSTTVFRETDDPERLLWALCLLNAASTQAFLDGKAVAAEGAARSYGEGLVGSLPAPLVPAESVRDFTARAAKVSDAIRLRYSVDETSSSFLAVECGDTLRNVSTTLRQPGLEFKLGCSGFPTVD